MMKIGRVNMIKDEIVENAVAAIEGAMGSVLKKWGNLRSVHIKTAESLALPVYQAVPEMGMKIEGVWDEGKGGSFAKGKKRGRDEERKGKEEKNWRIHDSGALDALDEDGGAGDGDVEDSSVGKIVKKKLKGGSDEVEGEKKGKKRMMDVVSKDDEEVDAKVMKKKGADDEDVVNKKRVKKTKKVAVVASIGTKKNKKKKKKLKN